jgi:hypothetical protein
MAGTFIDMVNRITTELRRSNLADAIKNGINDAIDEAAETRFYFNEMHASFPTVIGQEYYDDLGLVELDAAWYLNGTQQMPVDVINQFDANMFFGLGPSAGSLQLIARYGGKFRLYPIPNSVYTVYVDGFGKLAPSPLVADADTNAWMTEAEQFIRALAKRNVYRDVIRDYGEARIYEGVASDYQTLLVEKTTLKSGVDTLRSTEF